MANKHFAFQDALSGNAGRLVCTRLACLSANRLNQTCHVWAYQDFKTSLFVDFDADQRGWIIKVTIKVTIKVI